MNIDEYREMKAEMESTEGGEPIAQTESGTVEPIEQVVQTETQTSVTPEEPAIEEPTQVEPEATPAPIYEVGGKKFSTEQLDGIVKQSEDLLYQQQQINQEKERLGVQQQYYEAIQKNPEFAKKFADTFNLPFVTPEQEKIQELNNNYNRLLVKSELNDLRANYGDFDEREVIQYAVDHKVNSLEDAYLVLQSKKQQSNPRPEGVDLEALKSQIRQEVERELQSKVDTGTIISTRTANREIVDNTPQLSSAELRVAKAFKMKPEEYAKWANIK